MSDSDSSLTKLELFTSRLDEIRKAVQDLKSFTPDFRRCCRVTSKIISDCREAVQYTTDHPDTPKLFELGMKALQILYRSIRDAFTQETLDLLKWKTPSVVRRINLENEETLRSSVICIMLDQLYAHAALRDKLDTVMPDENDEEQNPVYEAHEDFFKLINKAFLVSFGDEINLQAGLVHSKYGIQIEASKVTDDRAWRLEMSGMAGRVLTALACCHSSWFHNQEIWIANQMVSGANQADGKKQDETGEQLCTLHPAESSCKLLSETENNTLDQQRIDLNALLKSTFTDLKDYVSKVHWGLKIVKTSVEAIQSSTDPAQFYSDQLFFYANQALTHLANAASEWFEEDVSPLPLTEFNLDTEANIDPELRPNLKFPKTGTLAERREWIIAQPLNSLYERKAGDSDRLDLAEAVLNLCSGMVLQEEPSNLLHNDASWRQVMLKSSSYALVGVAQYVLEYFPGKTIVLFKKHQAGDNNEVPRARDQRTEKWIWARKRLPSGRR